MWQQPLQRALGGGGGVSLQCASAVCQPAETKWIKSLFSRYDGMDMATMDCARVVLRPGDRLYLPFGTMHRASKNGAGGGNTFRVGIFLISFGFGPPRVLRAHMGRTCGEPKQIELTIRVLTGSFTALSRPGRRTTRPPCTRPSSTCRSGVKENECGAVSLVAPSPPARTEGKKKGARMGAASYVWMGKPTGIGRRR